MKQRWKSRASSEEEYDMRTGTSAVVSDLQKTCGNVV